MRSSVYRRDVETPAASLSLAGSSSNPTLVPNSNFAFGGSGSSRTVTILPATNQSGTATITITVSDPDGGSTNRSFVLTVNPVNDLPIISELADQTINEDASTGPIAFTVQDVETPADNLVVSATSSNPALAVAPNIVLGGSGNNRTIAINPVTNQFGTARITISVTDGNLAVVTRSFLLTVLSVNDLPTISNITDRTINEDTPTGLIPLTITDVETPAASLTLSASSSNPTLVPATNIVFGGIGSARTVNIRPATNQYGLATITITVQDANGGSTSDSFLLTVINVNDPPVLAPIRNRTIFEGNTLQLTASASDADPTNTLTFSLGPGAPVGASIDPLTGVFTWTPSEDQGPSTNLISIRVTDNGTPSLSATQIFTVRVFDALFDFLITAGSTNVVTGQTNSVPLTLASKAPLTNITFNLDTLETHLTNFAVQAVANQINPLTTSVQRIATNRFAIKINTLAGQFLQGTGQIARLSFKAVSNQNSIVLPFMLTNVAGVQSSGVQLKNGAGAGGKIIIVDGQPVLEAKTDASASRYLLLYGRAGASYTVESKTDWLAAAWSPLANIPMTNTLHRIDRIEQAASPIFYRAYEFSASPPLLAIQETNSIASLLLYGKKNSTYRLQSSPDLAGSGAWTSEIRVTLTNSYRFIDFTNPPAQPRRFFRAYQE